MTISEVFYALRVDAEDWCEGRSGILRIILLVGLAYLGFRYATNYTYGSIFSGLTLGIHELGHVIFRPLGEFMTYAGGSLTQVLAPIIAALVLFKQRDYFGVAVTGCWQSFSLYELATYMGDARSRELPLVSIGGGDTDHDWHYMLAEWDILEFDTRLATMTRALAFLLLLGSLSLGIWLCWRMAQSANRQKH